MDRNEFSNVITWLEVAIGRTIVDDRADDQAGTNRKARMKVYYECLGDLPAAAFSIAAKRCAMERKYQSFPPIAELREFATETVHGQVKELTGPEAWGIAMRVIGKFDVAYSDAHKAKILAEMPPIVHAAVSAFGFMAIYNLPSDAIETARAQFTKIFDNIAERERKTGLLPAPLHEQIKAIGSERVLQAPVASALAKIGSES